MLNNPHPLKNSTYLYLLIGLASLLGLYALLRYGNWWGEGDTAAFTRIIASMQASGELTPAEDVYQNGYGYPVLVTWLAALTGLPLSILQVAGGMLLAVWVIIPAWLAYREFTHSDLAASLGSLILLVQPEFLFPLLRGTHEKFTRGLMLICLYLLLRSLRSRGVRLTALLVISFYLCAYAMICFNTFMATSFILGVLLALGLVWLSGKWASTTRRSGTPVAAKLVYVTISMLVVAFVFTFYAYPPAQHLLQTLLGVGDRLALLILQVEDTAGNPYAVVNQGWISLPVYWLVSLANWILLAVSLVLWLRQSYLWLIRRAAQPARHELVLWAFYAAFAFLGLTSVLVDISGAIAANLQHRMFPSIVMLAAPLAGAWLANIRLSRDLRARATWVGASLILGALMVLSVLKATNEPLLSNTWLFYTPAERQAVLWAEHYLPQRSLWTDLGGRVANGFTIYTNGTIPALELDAYETKPANHNYLVSDVGWLYAQRLARQLPIQFDSLLTYDNGTAQIYHHRPQTIYQK